MSIFTNLVKSLPTSKFLQFSFYFGTIFLSILGILKILTPNKQLKLKKNWKIDILN
jgi:hypothetical protein